MLQEIARYKLLGIKVDSSSSSSQSEIRGFTSLSRLDRNTSGGGIMLFVREEIPSKLLNAHKPNSSVENSKVKIKEVALIIILQP